MGKKQWGCEMSTAVGLGDGGGRWCVPMIKFQRLCEQLYIPLLSLAAKHGFYFILVEASESVERENFLKATPADFQV